MAKQGWFANKWMTSYRLNALRTRWRAVIRPCRQTTPILIFGCQRSGTTMLSRLIGLSQDVKAYGDGDPEYFVRRGKAPRLREVSDVANQLKQERNRFALLKPLCESQRAAQLLEELPSAKAIWIYRHFEPCVRSQVRYYSQFHDAHSYLREMFDWNVPCWKNENLPADSRSFLSAQTLDSLNPESAYALYWLARNSLHSAQELPPSRVLLVNYEQILADPAVSTAKIFSFVEVPYRSAYADLIAPSAGSSRKPTPIAPHIAERCQRLYDELVARAAN